MIVTMDRNVAEGDGVAEGLEHFTENALKVLRARYLKKNEKGGCVETPEDLFRRVARTIAAIETQYGASEARRAEWEQRYYDLMVSQAFMPNSPTLMNAGREMGMLSACFVLPVEDSIEGIFDSIKHTALIQKAGGGTGFAFDALRPTGDFIQSSGGTTSGPISFWRAFSEATNAIQQGAFRRGANMGMMNIHHPDILKFVHAKQDLSQFTNYNISVKVTDEWMEQFLRDPDGPHIVVNPRNRKRFVLPKSLKIWEYTVKDLPAYDPNALPAEPLFTRRDLWNIIVDHAWQTGEPGVVFIDRINEANPTPHIGRIEATNPCGEQPLLPYEACNLGSINLGVFVRYPCTPHAEVDWEALRITVHESTRFLDNVIDANNYPLPQIDAICKANRKIGLGIMGFADALYKLNVRYNSPEGVAWGERFMKYVNDESHRCSELLAAERGAFPNWRGSRWDTEFHRPMRNACVTTVAPTGTISIIANCSGGIEPMFSLAFFRNVLKGQTEGKAPLVEVNETFARVARERGFLSEGLMDQIARDGTLAHIPGVPDDVRHVFVCAHDIEPEWHVRMQAAFQKHCDSSISKTINFPHEATRADVEKIYRLAYDLRCKGVTVYRDGCRASQPMALADSEKKPAQAGATASASNTAPNSGEDENTGPRITTETNLFGERITEIPPPITLEPAPLPALVSGVRVRQMTPFGNMHVNITVDPKQQRELEVFAQLGKGGDLANSDLEAICRMISLWLRSGGALSLVIQQLSGIGSSLQIPTRSGRIMSLGDGLAQALKRYQRAKERYGMKALLLGDVDPAELESASLVKPSGNGDKSHGVEHGGRATAATTAPGSSSSAPKGADGAAAPSSGRFSDWIVSGYKVKCPECGDDLDLGEGCKKCHNCGWAQC
ncbi:MAG: vitamin B12-dependent ribonucleotide reductase [Phycisphaerae bacterium]|nr:vitamin B12-dependent ribonucleotide reductase [Phycisphaerae bacterium]